MVIIYISDLTLKQIGGSKMLKKITGLISRIYDLIIKLISIKGIFSLLMTYLAITTKSDITSWFCFVSWVVFVGDRRLDKYLKDMIKSKFPTNEKE